MKQFLSYMIVALAALWTAGCSDDSLSPADQPERGIVIRLSTGDLETRTDLTSQANLQHVTEVYAVLYKGTGDAATFKSVEKLAWDPTEGGSYNDINGEEFVLPQTKTAGLEAGDYTVLCVGLDDRSGETYGLTLDKMKTWTTLKDARATLAARKGVDDIAHAELFAGWSGFEFKPDSINVVEVMLKRRVAGVLCYVTDIPTTINRGGVNEPVKKLRLALYTGEKPNNQISLCRKEVEKATDGTIKIPDDFGENNPNPNAAQLTHSKGYLILKEIDLEHLYNSDGSQTGEIFVIPEIKTDALKVEANSLLLGAYVIPTAATEGEVTLKVELLGEKDRVLATFNAKRDGTSESESYYNIYPNYIYHIGDKPESDSTEGDQPASLLGKELTVKPQPWDEELLVDVEFPSVPVKPSFDNASDFKRQILDCIGQSMTLTIRNAVVHTAWTLTTKTEGVYFLKDKEKGEYDKIYTPGDSELSASKVNVEIVITDYAVYNDYTVTPVEEDKRALNILLMVGSETIDIINFEQWNALIVGVRGSDDKDDEIDHYVGFNRYDRSNKEWGFDGVGDSGLGGFLGFSYNNDSKNLLGSYNYGRVVEAKGTGWDSSAIYKSHVDGYTFDNGIVIENISEYQWYLGSFWEYYALFDKAWYLKNIGDNGYNSYFLRERSDKNDVQNVYWTSSVVQSTISYAWAGYIMRNKNHKDGWKDFFDNSLAGYNDSNKREKSYYTRLCKKIQSL